MQNSVEIKEEFSLKVVHFHDVSVYIISTRVCFTFGGEICSMKIFRLIPDSLFSLMPLFSSGSRNDGVENFLISLAESGESLCKSGM